MTVVAVIAGAVGAACRYLVSGVVQERSDSDFPLGTLVVNLAGSFLLGAVAGAGTLTSWTTLALVGFLGGFTTFSTWMIETVRLGIGSSTARAVANLMLTLVAGVALAAAGYAWAG
jgi:CrcB protein